MRACVYAPHLVESRECLAAPEKRFDIVGLDGAMSRFSIAMAQAGQKLLEGKRTTMALLRREKKNEEKERSRERKKTFNVFY